MKITKQSETEKIVVRRAGKARGPVKRDAKEVMAELVTKLSQQLDERQVPAGTAGRDDQSPEPNRDRLTVGVDLGDKWSNYCVLGLDGETLVEGELQTSQRCFSEFFAALMPARVVMEVGTHSAWAHDAVAGCGHEVLVANPRQMEGPKQRKRKNDRIDAHKLARVGRMDPQSLFPIQHRNVEVRRDLLALRARGALVAVRTELINATRGLVKSMGARLPKCSTEAFANKAKQELPAEVRDILRPLVDMVKSVSEFIRSYDERIDRIATEKYPQTKMLRQVKGVGPLTSLAYVLTLEDPKRFARSRDVGPYIGLVPKQEDSGDRQPQLRISKMGDVMLRSLLVGSAQYSLGPFGPDTDQRRYGLRMCQRGGRNAKKRAVVAVARKLSVLLHKLWISGKVYEPLGYNLPKTSDHMAA
jgi:transposase